jgi:hypothetical protein
MLLCRSSSRKGVSGGGSWVEAAIKLRPAGWLGYPAAAELSSAHISSFGASHRLVHARQTVGAVVLRSRSIRRMIAANSARGTAHRFPTRRSGA